MRQKWLPDPDNPAEIKLRKQMDKKNVRERLRKNKRLAENVERDKSSIHQTQAWSQATRTKVVDFTVELIFNKVLLQRCSKSTDRIFRHRHAGQLSRDEGPERSRGYH